VTFALSHLRQMNLYGPKGQEDKVTQAKAWFVVSVVCGPKGHESIAQGLPWVIHPNRISPEGATRYGENRPRTFEPDRVRISSPFRAKRFFWLTQGKPWAKLSCPFGAEPSGRITDAKQTQSLGHVALRAVQSTKNGNLFLP
jgi:hypothetical protein